MVQSVHGVVLRSEDAGEFDLKITLYTREFGKFCVKVAGVKKVVSKLRALTLPFAESSFHVFLHGNVRAGVNDPGKLIGGETQVSHTLLREDWERMTQASHFCETLDVLTKTFYPNEQEYNLLIQTLRDMETRSHPALVRLRSTLILLKVLGYGLRHHPAWKAFTEMERNLLLRLGNWKGEENYFSEIESRTLNRLTQSYLYLFLPAPLKSEIFARKIQQMGVPA